MLEHIEKSYQPSCRALDDLSLGVRDGELLTVVGPSGCGKSTLLRIVAGLTAPTHGTVKIGGVAVDRWPAHRRNLAFVFQRPALVPHLEVRANLTRGLLLRSRWLTTTREERRRVEEIADVLGLTPLLERRPAQLSGGEQQRVALGRALVRRPAAFLLDEPLSSLDTPLRLEMRREIRRLQRHFHATMLYVTHDQDEALALGDRVAVLHAGKLLQVGTSAELVNQPVNRQVAAFLGWPPLSFLTGAIVDSDDGPRLIATDVNLAVPAAWKSMPAIEIAVRPENIRLEADESPGTIRMEVRRVESSGRGSLLTLMRGPWTAHTCVAGGAPHEGSCVSVRFDLARAHLFDLATGQAVLAG